MQRLNSGKKSQPNLKPNAKSLKSSKSTMPTWLRLDARTVTAKLQTFKTPSSLVASSLQRSVEIAMSKTLSFDDLKSRVTAGDIDTVLVCLVDMQGRLMGNAFTP